MEIGLSFEYDLWANTAWIPLCERAEMRRVMEHILGAQAIWLKRCGGELLDETGDLRADAGALNRAWTTQLEHNDLEQVIQYKSLAGQDFSNQLVEIARHVLNHGTYHRGQLRAMAEALGIDPFPETDYIGFLRRTS